MFDRVQLEQLRCIYSSGHQSPAPERLSDVQATNADQRHFYKTPVKLHITNGCAYGISSATYERQQLCVGLYRTAVHYIPLLIINVNEKLRNKQHKYLCEKRKI